MRDVMIAEMGKSEDDSFPKLPDEDLLLQFHNCKSSSSPPVTSLPGTCGDVGRRKREITGMVGRPHKREAVETVEELEERSYGSRLRYECGLARRFVDPETGGHYLERWMQVGDDGGDRITMCPQCNWNNSWTPTDSLDSCDWVQCLYPPPPPVSSHCHPARKQPGSISGTRWAVAAVAGRASGLPRQRQLHLRGGGHLLRVGQGGWALSLWVMS